MYAFKSACQNAMEPVVGYLLFVLMGLALGMTGAGGSALTIPILVYVFGVDFVKAGLYSLIVVAVVSGLGAFSVRQSIKFWDSLIFAVPSMIAVFTSRTYLVPYITAVMQPFLMLMLGLMMCAAGYKTMYSGVMRSTAHSTKAAHVMIVGTTFGLMMGIMGIGGGFLVVPILVLFLGFPIKNAISTSLFIVTLNAFVGFFSDKQILLYSDYSMLFKILLISIIGMFIGQQVIKKSDAAIVQKAFGIILILAGAGTFFKEIWSLI